MDGILRLGFSTTDANNQTTRQKAITTILYIITCRFLSRPRTCDNHNPFASSNVDRVHKISFLVARLTLFDWNMVGIFVVYCCFCSEGVGAGAGAGAGHDNFCCRH